MMRVAIYAINYAPELTGCGKYTGEMARWLAANGCRVDVVTTPPYYPEWAVREGYESLRYQSAIEQTDGEPIRVTRCPLFVPAKVTGKSRLLHLLSFALSSAPALVRTLWRKQDLLILVLPTLACAPLALLLGRLFGVRIWVHVQDFEVDAAFGLGVISGGMTRQIASAIESRLLRAFDRVSSITPRMVERATAKGVASEKALLFPNWVDLSAIYPLQGPNAFRAELGLGDKDVLLLYSGNMGEKQGIEIIIDAARQLEVLPRVRFALVGSGAALERLKASGAGLSNVCWLPLQPMEKLNVMLNAADIHLLPQRADAADLVMPSKLTGMLASAKAVIGTAAAGTQLGDVLDQVGVRVEPGDTEAFVSAIQTIASDGVHRATLGQLGRRYAEEHLDCDHIMNRFLLDARKCCGFASIDAVQAHSVAR
ncbi:MAG: WcaI family glycosyltransferase [Methyloversatilis sp.]|uniref:WcaI family glycosyltransferase n=1 Tax=Methyloversatilis sp. TaxID=2569862 RepID=UPI00273707B8|nr:WcaI family glycosyltransferase [Methyloversatilis sp.]MDP3873736.1 WcaI family glycosyltransferase [Methyloversatilis sp.]